MGFLKRNSGKIALIAIIAFFTLPFIYGNEEEEDFSPFAVKSGMSYQANPISKMANKIASFYGFSRPASNSMTASADKTASIKEKVADNHVFSRESYFFDSQTGKKVNSKDNNLVASSRKFTNFDNAGTPYSIGSNSQVYNGTNNYSGGTNANVNNPVKGYVTINGQKYAVIEDAKGERYVVTPKGHIPYKEVMKRNISEEEFISAKKRLVGASDMEVLNALQKEKEMQAASANTKVQNYQGSATGYRNGTATNMGNQNYARVSTSDRGFDDNVLSDAYANLKNINVKVDSSKGGNGSRGATYNNYYGSGSGNGQGEKEGDVFTPENIASQARSAAQQEVVAKNDAVIAAKLNNAKENVLKPKTGEEAILTAVSEAGTSAIVATGSMTGAAFYERMVQMPKIQNLQSISGGVGYEVSNDSTAGEILFAEAVDENNIYSREWGAPVKVEIGTSEEPRLESGVILPKVVGTKLFPPNLDKLNKKTLETIDTQLIETNTGKINGSIEEIRDIVDNLPPNVQKIYIGPSDEPSAELMRNIMKVSMPDDTKISLITDNKEEADIALPGVVLTPRYFEIFVDEFRTKAEEMSNSEMGNLPS